MGWGTPDAYYQPEELGLTIVAEVEYSDMDYQFDTRVVWRHDDGRLLTARDSGCSCPSPFEDYTSVEKLDPVDFAELEAEFKQESREDRYSGNPKIEAEGLAFLAKVREAIRNS